MAETISRRRLTAEAWVQSQASLCGICGGQSGVGRTSLSPSQYYSTGAPCSLLRE